ncbi:MAG: GtrA family protein [Oscillospiraceae bacterium]|jgi:putative flippase GtrA|nr:GtrA family protein [Oscillospiraceae bacterium]
MTNKRKELIRTLKFTLFSISAGLIQEGTFLLMYNVLHWDYWPSYLISLALSVVYNFTVNRKFTFHSAANVPVAMAKVFGYYCVFTPLSTIGGDWLVKQCGWNGNLVQILTMLLNFVTEFLFTRFVVYGKQVDNDGTVPKEKTV